MIRCYMSKEQNVERIFSKLVSVDVIKTFIRGKRNYLYGCRVYEFDRIVVYHTVTPYLAGYLRREGHSVGALGKEQVWSFHVVVEIKGDSYFDRAIRGIANIIYNRKLRKGLPKDME